MKKLLAGIVGTLCFLPLAHADEERTLCNGGTQTILSVADFDGDGSVTAKDMVVIRNAVEQENYYAFFDINMDGELDKKDIARASADIGQQSTYTDRLLAYLFHRTKQYALISSPEELNASGFSLIADSLAGHGQHWTDFINASGVNFWQPSGLNYSKESKQVNAVFWSKEAVPVFENGANDYPIPGGAWETQKVVAFSDHAPVFTGDGAEVWHTHAGLCITAEGTTQEPVIQLNQHTTFAQCQSFPSLIKVPGTNYNAWLNLWMLHAWLFDLNPNGVFANTHPCTDPNAVQEAAINGDREVPEFFRHHH